MQRQKLNRFNPLLLVAWGIAVLLSPCPATAATFTVSSKLDDADANPGDGICRSSDYRCTLRAAINEANATATADTINFAVGGTIITDGPLSIESPMTISGPRARALTVRRSTTVGTHSFRLLDIDAAAGSVTISGLTLSNGRSEGNPGSNGSTGIAGQGGAILNRATLALTECVLSGNMAVGGNGGNGLDGSSGNGGAGGAGQGGAIFNRGTLTISRCTFSGNLANGGKGGLGGSGSDTGGNGGAGGAGQGGAICNLGTISMPNSTLSGNQASGGRGGDGRASADTGGSGGTGGNGQGGSVFTAVGSTALVSDTLADSTATGGNGGSGAAGGTFSGSNGRAGYGQGGGLHHTSGITRLKNTIVAGNTAAGYSRAPDVSGACTSQGHNLIGTRTGSTGFSNGTNGDQVGTTSAPLDPLLGPLLDNGGVTPTHALLPGSPAIDAGNNTNALLLDQRRIRRPQPAGGIVDIGAYEVEKTPQTGPTFTVNTNSISDSDDGSCGVQNCTLREAINAANGHANGATPDTIKFNIPTWPDTDGTHTIAPRSALPTITDPVIIDGYSQPGATLATSSATAVLKIELSGVNASAGINGLTINAGGSTVRGLVINRFSGNGIVLQTQGGNAIEGNFIGIIVVGNQRAGNAQSGVLIDGAPSNLVGGTTVEKRNVISGNLGSGITLSAAGATGNIVQGNLIGGPASGDLTVGNEQHGIFISGALNSMIGGAGGSSNTIRFNFKSGVLVNSGTGNTIRGNSIRNNSALGIDLAPAGVHSNDIGDGDSGANNQQNFPVLTRADNIDGPTAIGGRLNSKPNATYTIDFYANTFADTSAGFGEGERLIGSLVTQPTDSNGNVNFTFTPTTAIAVGQFISAIATDAQGNTSEFSNARMVSDSLVVTNTKNTGPGSLRAAIDGANGHPNGAAPDKITFNIPTGASGYTSTGNGFFTISPASDLPAITDPVIIDGYTQPGDTATGTPKATPNTLANGDNAILKIQLNSGSLNAKRGLIITAHSSIVRGLVINRFDQGILLQTGGDNIIEGNFIGTDVTGTQSVANNIGVQISNAASNLVGGTTAAARNVIAFNARHGVFVDASLGSATGNSIRGNLIHDNGKLGINLRAAGESVDAALPTPNDAADTDQGANDLQNFPKVVAATNSGGSTTITGTLNSTPNAVFTLEFYANVVCDSSGNGEGKRFLGSLTTSPTNSSGNVNFTFMPATAVPSGQFITATATAPNGSTSEFSACTQATPTG